MLGRIQQDLFDVGADLCVPGEAGTRLRVTDAPGVRLEAEVTAMNAALTPLSSFILPGGTPAAAHAHLARTVVRRAERRVVHLNREQPINPAVVRFLNRLSDHLFVLGRRLNPGGRRPMDPGGEPLMDQHPDPHMIKGRTPQGRPVRHAAAPQPTDDLSWAGCSSSPASGS